MHAVFVEVDVAPDSAEKALEHLKSVVVPRVSAAPGFVSGVWLEPVSESGGVRGNSLVLFDSEDNARAAAERLEPGLPDGVTMRKLEVRGVIASAGSPAAVS